MDRISVRNGVQFLGISDLDVEKDYQNFQFWLSKNKHGCMSYLENHLNLRRNPELLFETAKCAIIFAKFYGAKPNLKNVAASPRNSLLNMTAKYARSRDYHKILRTEIEETLNEFKKLENIEPFSYRICIDSAPLLERALASKTLPIFIGKNTCGIHHQYGSFFFIATALISIKLPIDSNQNNFCEIKAKQKARSQWGGCGSCRRCQVHCPTNALHQDYSLDASRCLAYWTIEHRGTIPLEYWPYLNKYFFGCDICQDVCPYNRTAKEVVLTENWQRSFPNISFDDIALMSQQQYVEWFGGTPLTRAKIDGLRRNAIIVLTINRYKKLDHIFTQLSQDSSKVIIETIKQAKIYLSSNP